MMPFVDLPPAVQVGGVARDVPVLVRPGEPGGPRAASRRPSAREGAADAIRRLIERHRRALEARDVAAVSATHVAFGRSQRAAVARYFAMVERLRVRIKHIDIAIVGDTAVVSYTRIDRFVETSTGSKRRVATRPTRTLCRVDGDWRFTGVE